MNTRTEQEERAEFERAMVQVAEVDGYERPEYVLERNTSGDYSTTWVRGAWIGWRAKAVDAAIKVRA
ncbi:hypothetical protein [Hydrogenophaga sp.]|uniref:hypothetical protein n=1 Tax=Hydrogenophaga sp. TaxID=1904254 RepID=UPI002726042D|nr:hypothetical protein [Hydrogenophaga sp.]MDO9131993.1 hypothetical protein [Hydrogenophaga sp.]